MRAPAHLRIGWSLALALCAAACTHDDSAQGNGAAATAAAARATATANALENAPDNPTRNASPPLVRAARAQIGVTVRYDPAYVVLPYPGGDVPQDRGVCTDVVIRAFRAQGLDLQRAVHEDMRAHFGAYPKRWGLRAPDPNIDHRRVPNLQVWFERQGWSLPTSARGEDYLPGDVVTWMLPGQLPHIGIVGDRRLSSGAPLIVHNIGDGTHENDILFAYPITGHYRPALPARATQPRT